MAKSAEAIERKWLLSAPLRKRVRKSLKIKGLDEERHLREKRLSSDAPDAE